MYNKVRIGSLAAFFYLCKGMIEYMGNLSSADTAQLSEEELITRCCNGDDKAWRILYERFYSYIFHLVKGKNYHFTMQDTQDITHEVFLDLIKGISSFQKKSILKTYIHSLTLNRVRQHFRKNLTIKRGGSVEKISLDDIDIDLADHRIISPDFAIMRKEEILNLRDKMSELPGHLRKVLQLRYEKNFKYKEIADEMDIPEGSVGALIQKALLRLRELIVKE